jgi:hypothetical protein
MSPSTCPELLPILFGASCNTSKLIWVETFIASAVISHILFNACLDILTTGLAIL